MGRKFWVRRFLWVLAGAFIIISGAQIIKGHEVVYAIIQGAIWAVPTAVIFILARLYQSSKGQHCAVCKDTPEMQSEHNGK